jgi:hypothetical protein
MNYLGHEARHLTIWSEVIVMRRISHGGQIHYRATLEAINRCAPHDGGPLDSRIFARSIGRRPPVRRTSIRRSAPNA